MRPTRNVLSIGFVSLICVGTALWFFAHILRNLRGDHPALINIGLMIAGIGVAGLSLLNVHRGMGKKHIGVVIVGIGLILLAGRSLLVSLGGG